MSPEAPPSWFGRSPAQAARGALVLTVLGCLAVLAVTRLLTRPHTPTGEAFRAAGVPASVPVAVGLPGVVALAAYGYLRSVRTAPRFRISEQGLTVVGPPGEYTVERNNLADMGITSTGALGLRLESRERLLATHRGTEQQREWLRTAEPYGEWDLVFHPSELGRSPEEVLSWLR